MSELTFYHELHQYTYEDEVIPSVTQILKETGLVSFDHIPKEVLDIAAARGTRVHKCTHYYDESDLNWETVNEDDLPYVEAWRKFIEETKFESELIETKLFHPDYRYAGRLDRFGMLGEEQVVLDIKTGAVYPSTALQLAGYAMALTPDYHGIGRIAVQLKKNGRYTIHRYTDNDDYQVFLCTLSVANWNREHNAKGMEIDDDSDTTDDDCD